MSDTILGALLGLAVSFQFALAAFLQQRASHDADLSGHSLVESASILMRTLLQTPLWLIGWLVNLGGFLTQAVALHFTSVVAVQPMLVTQLLFVLPMASLEGRIRPLARDWISALTITAGLVVLIVTVPAKPLEGEPDRNIIWLAAVSAVLFAVLALPLARRVGSDTLSITAAVCAGLFFAMTAVFIKLTTTDLFDHGVAYTARDWVGYALAGSTALGLILGQMAFAYGRLPWVVATKETVNPIVSYAIGVMAFPVALPAGSASRVGLSAAAVLIVLGAVGLAGSPMATSWFHRESDQDDGAPGRSERDR